jgi:hypothetical protein
MDPFYEDDDFLRREYALLGNSVRLTPRLSNADAARHITSGFDRRLLMIQSSRVRLRERATRARTPPPSPYEIEELNVHINSYYINLRGCLDNIAWAMQYEFSLLPGVTEAKGGNRQRINLFGKEFLLALEKRDTALVDKIRTFSQWELELRELRDPVAHRVPLSLVGGILAEDKREEFELLQKRAAAPREELEGLPRSHYVQAAYNLLQYAPLLQVTSNKGVPAREIPEQVANDHTNFLSVCEPALRHLWGFTR